MIGPIATDPPKPRNYLRPKDACRQLGGMGLSTPVWPTLTGRCSRSRLPCSPPFSFVFPSRGSDRSYQRAVGPGDRRPECGASLSPNSWKSAAAETWWSMFPPKFSDVFKQ